MRKPFDFTEFVGKCDEVFLKSFALLKLPVMNPNQVKKKHRHDCAFALTPSYVLIDLIGDIWRPILI